MNKVRYAVGLYQNHPLAQAILDGTLQREHALQHAGAKQMNHVRRTDGWWLSMFVIEVTGLE